jgi:O-succinylbenzoate synthase
MACGLATVALLAGDVSDNPLLPINGMLPVRRVEASDARLTEFAADPERSAWWAERIQRCYEQAIAELDVR